ncbi:MAG: metalloregulator ArsR/SmtB family transcription factor [Rhizobiaceae bacterium]|nr:metalloregulator ArsR/SmtB family transcription factor [Rhizobiaceae bacterium]MCV0405088.1 metalloregulator ArsR/SmtB family transcription factor [Rhizobiaceae bacterium]
MVDYQDHQLDRIFHALSDPTRRAMLARLAEREHTVSDLAAPFSMSLAGASKHVRVLEQAGMVRRRIVGRTHHCRLEAARMKEARDWINRYEKFWTGRLDALEALLAGENRKPEDRKESGS